MSHGRKGERSITGCSDFQAQSLSLRMPVVAKRDEAHVLAVASNTSCQTRGELVFNLAAAKRQKPQPTLVTGNAPVHTQQESISNLGGLRLPADSLSSARFQHCLQKLLGQAVTGFKGPASTPTQLIDFPAHPFFPIMLYSMASWFGREGDLAGKFYRNTLSRFIGLVFQGIDKMHTAERLPF